MFDLITLNMYHVLHYAACGIVCTQFELGQPICIWFIAFLLLIRCHAVTLTFDPLTFNSCGRSVVIVIKLCTKFERDRSIRSWVIDDLANFLSAGATFQLNISERGEPNCIIFGENKVPSSMHQIGSFGIDALLCFQTRAAQRRVVSKWRPNFTVFDIRGVRENAEWEYRVYTTT